MSIKKSQKRDENKQKKRGKNKQNNHDNKSGNKFKDFFKEHIGKPWSEEISELKILYSLHKRKLFLVLTIIGLLFSFLFVFNFVIGIKAVYSEDIVMETIPHQVSLDLRYNESEEVIISTAARNNLLCRSQCNHELLALDTGELLYQSNFSFIGFKNVFMEYDFLADQFGQGQSLFLYTISCKNVASDICKTRGELFTRDILITLNYEPTEEQVIKKEQLKSTIGRIAVNLESFDSYMKTLDFYLDSYDFKKDDLEQRFSFLKSLSEDISSDVFVLEELWLTQDYDLVDDFLVQKNLFERAIFAESQASELYLKVEERISFYNELLDFFNNDSTKNFIDDASRTIKLFNDADYVNYTNFSVFNSSNLHLFRDNINYLIFEFNNLSKLFEESFDYESLLVETRNLSMFIVSLKEDYFLLVSENTDFYDYALSRALFLELDNCVLSNESCNHNFDLFFDNQKFSDSNSFISWNSEFQQHICNVSSLSEDVMRLNEESLVARQNNVSSVVLSVADYEKFSVDYSFLLNLKSFVSDDTFNVLYDKLLFIDNGSFSDSFNGSLSSTNYYDRYNSSLYYLFLSNSLDYSGLDSFCFTNNFYLLEKDSLDSLVKISSERSIILDESLPRCCFMGVCKTCCDEFYCKEKYPLILLHGYSYYNFNSAYHSTNAYNSMTQRLWEDSLYLPAGILGKGADVSFSNGDLSRNFVPNSFKVTYYNIKGFEDILPGEINVESEGMLAYAEKLNDVVEQVKNMSGSSKVDILAHSMGGVVTRTYIKKYGDDSLNKVILVGTPNHGVPSTMRNLCKLFGGSRECDELHEDSNFMDWLNNPLESPNVDVFMIVGRGCNTFGVDGDGVVGSESAYLDYAQNYFVNGSCDLIDNFHRDMIKPHKYPEIYRLIRNILLI